MAAGQTTKFCTKCKTEKPLSYFSKDARRIDGLGAKCKACKAESSRTYYALHAEEERSARRTYYKNNKEKVLASNAAWIANNRDRKRATDAAWYLANKDMRAGYSSKWYVANPEKRRIHSNNRRARKCSDCGKLSSELASKLFKLQRGKCACCGRPLGNDYHLDHIMPLALGGSNTDDNIQLLRAECNHQKHAKHPVDFMRQRGFLL